MPLWALRGNRAHLALGKDQTPLSLALVVRIQPLPLFLASSLVLESEAGNSEEQREHYSQWFLGVTSGVAAGAEACSTVGVHAGVLVPDCWACILALPLIRWVSVHFDSSTSKIRPAVLDITVFSQHSSQNDLCKISVALLTSHQFLIVSQILFLLSKCQQYIKGHPLQLISRHYNLICYSFLRLMPHIPYIWERNNRDKTMLNKLLSIPNLSKVPQMYLSNYNLPGFLAVFRAFEAYSYLS